MGTQKNASATPSNPRKLIALGRSRTIMILPWGEFRELSIQLRDSIGQLRRYRGDQRDNFRLDWNEEFMRGEFEKYRSLGQLAQNGDERCMYQLRKAIIKLIREPNCAGITLEQLKTLFPNWWGIPGMETRVTYALDQWDLNAGQIFRDQAAAEATEERRRLLTTRLL